MFEVHINKQFLKGHIHEQFLKAHRGVRGSVEEKIS